MGFISEKARTCKGISPILTTIMLCKIAIVAIAVMYPIVSSAMSAPVNAISITQTSLIKQGNYIVSTMNLKNTGSARVTVGCTLYDGSASKRICVTLATPQESSDNRRHTRAPPPPPEVEASGGEA